ncbi:MAG: antibiotic biosynthesis monooxygenase [Gammaproteobacteria bacterium]|jgi:quinol monooxygenase YgiN
MIVIKGRIDWQDGTPPLSALANFAQTVRERHSGNLEYQLSVDVGNSKILHLFEHWKSRGDFDAHLLSPEVAEIGKFLEGKSTIVNLSVFDVSDRSELV